MSIYRKMLSLILSVLIFLSLIPPVSLNAKPESGNYPEYIEVTVLADKKNGDYNVPAEDAVVTLKNGETVLLQALSDAEGKVSFDISGLDPELLKNATVQAYITADRGKGINGSARDDLFSHFPKDESGEYYRYEYQLHSENIDEDGNWRGHELPFSVSDALDIVFVIDGTGSMYDRLDNVKKNLSDYIRGITGLGWDVRYSVLEYRDYFTGELPVLHEAGGSHWYRNEDDVIAELEKIQADGGGDLDESLNDALDSVIVSNNIDFRRNSCRLAVIVTDADSTISVRDGAIIENSRIGEYLSKMDVCTPVVIPADPELDERYQYIYKRTGGISLDIDDADFSQGLLEFTKSWAGRESAEIELKLSEPRMLYNLSVCYLANDTDSLSDTYRDSIKKMLDQYSRKLAQTTDGHVYVNKILLFSTDSIMNFMDEENLASMADIQIQTKVTETGSDSNNVKIHANAHVGGFYIDSTVDSSVNIEKFTKNLPDADSYDGRHGFTRIQLSGTLGAGWNQDFIKEPAEYAETIIHESGHYLFGFRDEYVDQNKNEWVKKEKPYALFGVMDDQGEDIELSKRWIDYAYLSSEADLSHTTYQFYCYTKSCEQVLADLLQNGMVEMKNGNTGFTGSIPFGQSFLNSSYEAGYETANYNIYQADRTADYEYAGLNEDNYIYLDAPPSDGSAAFTGADAFLEDSGIKPENAAKTEPEFNGKPQESSEDAFILEFPGDLQYSLYLRGVKDSGFSELVFSDGGDGKQRAELPVGEGGLAEFLLIREEGREKTAITGFIERTKPARAYKYCSPDFRVSAFVEAPQDASFTFLADDSLYINGEYTSLNQALHIYSDAAEITNGIIYSAAELTGNIDFSSISWYKYDGENWIMLPTELSLEENQNPGASAQISGEGLYVLMGKKAANGAAAAPDFLTYEPSSVQDGFVTLYFDDLNENSQYYCVYYSKDTESVLNEENADMKVCAASGCYYSSETGRMLTLNLRERGELFRIDVVIVLKDGSRSPAATVLALAPAADRDGDGIPDWYLDKYGLWLEDYSRIAGSDPDGDGFTNLEEYFMGTNPIAFDEPHPEKADGQDHSEEIIR